MHIHFSLFGSAITYTAQDEILAHHTNCETSLIGEVI